VIIIHAQCTNGNAIFVSTDSSGYKKVMHFRRKIENFELVGVA